MPFRRWLDQLAELRRAERDGRASQRSETCERATHYEAYEDRLALSADPVGGLLLDAVGPAAATPSAGEIAPHARAAANDYGLEYVRRTYGFLGAGQTVAVIDSGIAYDHPALGGGLGASYRVVGGWDFAENDADPYDDAPGGFHGTHIAGIVGSTDATYRGVAPEVDLVGLRVFDDQGASDIAWVEQALRWVHENRHAFANPITTVNLSFGIDETTELSASDRLDDELAQLKADGILVVASAGNSFAQDRAVGVSFPASSPYVVPVASVGVHGDLSDFSRRDNRVLAAPGERITSTVPDFAKNLDGRTNDFERSTGTSMAAPFVAGASVLVREAMLAAGRTEATVDAIYDHLRSTSDQVFDAITNAVYHRINVGRAIDAVMSADDYGSTVADAFSLNVIDGDRTLAGVLGRSDDVDYFRFIAGESGVVQLRAQPAGGLTTQWRLADGAASDGAVLAFEVIAGEAYTVGLAAKAGVGRYDVSVSLAPVVAAVDWGAVAFGEFAGEAFPGSEARRTLQASRDGVLTIEAFFAHAAGDIDLELYDAQGRLAAASRTTADYERLDVTALAGQTYSLKVIGANGDVDFRLTNLVSAAAGSINVGGTAGADAFAFSTGANHAIQVNGVAYQFSAQEFPRVQFQGGGGKDTLAITGTSGDERLTARPGDVVYVGAGWSLTAADVETVQVQGGGGRDEAVLHDSPGHDRFEGSPQEARLRGDAFDHHMVGFAAVQVQGSHGFDTAFLADSTGNDVFVARAGAASLTGPGYRLETSGFDHVRASATLGDDRAELRDSTDDDRFFARPGLAWMTGNAYLNYTLGFDSVHAYASGGGFDMAWLFDSSSHDRLTVRSTEVLLSGAGFQQTATGFGTVRAIASAGGEDRAEFYRTAGDAFSMVRSEARQSGPGYMNIATYFRHVEERPSAQVQQAAFRDLEKDLLETRDLHALAVSRQLPSGTCTPADLHAVDSLFQEFGVAQ